MTSKTEICSAIKEGEEPLDTLRKGFDYIMANLAKGLTTSEYINLYTLVHDYCTDRTSCQSATGGATDPESASFHGWRLYKELKLYLTKHLRNMAATLQDKRGKELLELLIENWDRYTTAASIISGVMAYINRHWAGRHLVDNKPAHDTYTLSLVLWKEIMIVEASQLRENVIEAVIDLIKLERDGYGSEHLIIKNALDIFVSASTEGPESSRQFPEIYRFHFELVFIDRTVEYYTKKSSDIISSKSIVAYMHEVERIFEEERERMAAYLFKTTHEPLIVVLERTLIEDHSREIESEFYSLIKQDRPEEVRLTHKLLSCVPHSLRRLTHLFEYYSRTEGLEQIEKISTTAPQPQAGSPTSAAASSLTSLQAQPKKESASAQVSPQLYFNTIIQIHKKLSHIVHNALGDDYSFVNAMDKAFRDFINTNSICLENPKKSIELLVRYADGILRKDNKTTLSKDSIEENLNYVITVFKYIEDKDFFQKLYQKMFAKRLIYSVCIKELEEKMICLLRDACGVEYSGKLSRMYNDIEISAELCAGFRYATSHLVSFANTCSLLCTNVQRIHERQRTRCRPERRKFPRRRRPLAAGSPASSTEATPRGESGPNTTSH